MTYTFYKQGGSKQEWNSNLETKQICLNTVALIRKQTIPIERPPLVGEVNAKFADRGCHVIRATDPTSVCL
jgi:hypothetical protein